MVKIDYGELADLAKDVEKAAKEANNYADDLDKELKNRIRNYPGKHTGNINTAASKVEAKSRALRDKATKLYNYKGKIIDFRNTAMSAENRLTGRISGLMGDFKRRWGIKEPGFFERLIEGFCDFIGLGDFFDSCRRFFKNLDAFIKSLWENVKDWYHFRGGAEIVDAVIAIVVTVALVIADIALTIVTVGAWKVVTLIVFAVATFVAFANMFAKIGAYINAMSQDNVLHKSAMNNIAKDMDCATWLRRNGCYEAAKVFQVVEIVVTIIQIAKDFKEFAGNFKNRIKGTAFKNFWNNVKNGLTKLVAKPTDLEGRIKQIKNVIKMSSGFYDMIRTNNFGKDFGTAFWDTIKNGKDTWDTLFKNSIGKGFGFEYKGTDGKTSFQDFYKLYDDVYKPIVKDVISKGKAIDLHSKLNLTNFTYNSDIDSAKNLGKFWDASTSPTKLAKWISGTVFPDGIDISVCGPLIAKPGFMDTLTGIGGAIGNMFTGGIPKWRPFSGNLGTGLSSFPRVMHTTPPGLYRPTPLPLAAGGGW